MLKSTLAKWALAALLAVPTVSLLPSAAPAATTKTLSSHLHKKHTLSSLHRHHRRLHSRKHRHVVLSSKHHRHISSLSARTVHPTVKIDKMPPTIDGMNT
jgi:hypothetical protein